MRKVKDIVLEFLTKHDIPLDKIKVSDDIVKIQSEFYRAGIERKFDIFLKMLIETTLQEIRSRFGK